MIINTTIIRLPSTIRPSIDVVGILYFASDYTHEAFLHLCDNLYAVATESIDRGVAGIICLSVRLESLKLVNK